MSLLPVIRLIRPQQWVKNLFVFLPVFCGGQLGRSDLWADALVTFIAFSLTASAVYCLNDLRDVEADRMHPRKCRRPVASGLVSVPTAIIIMILAAAGGIGLAWQGEGMPVGIIIGGYLLMNIAYCLWLKYIAVVDVFIVAIGFVLRVMAGGVACGIELSPWIMSLTFLLALFLAFAKRRDDVVIFEDTGVVARESSRQYNLAFLNQTLAILGAVTMVCYIMYTMSPDVMTRLRSPYLYATSIFVLGGILRYLQIALVDRRSGSPTDVMLHDRFIQLCVAGWSLSFILILYF